LGPLNDRPRRVQGEIVIIFKNVSDQLEINISIDKDAPLAVVVDAFVNFVRCAGYECDAQAIKDLLEEQP
jgi:hypothetical protein